MTTLPTTTVKLQKWIILAVVVSVIFLLRHLLPVIFLTFILAYIGNTLVARLTLRFPYRRFNLVLTYLVLIAVLTLVGSFVIPRLFGEARDLARSYVMRDNALHAVEDAVPVEPAAEPVVRDGHPVSGVPVVAGDTVVADTSTVINRATRQYLDIAIRNVVGDEGSARFQQSTAYHDLLDRIEAGVNAFIPKIIAGVTEFLNRLVVVTFYFVLSIIFSFIILWRLPELTEGAKSFGRGRTAELYASLAPGFRAFGLTMGRAFEAQTVIAIVNSLLTALGFWALGIPSIALLSTIVFFCSYVPVLGVILSTLPAALLAFKVGGFVTIAWLVVMILVVHAIETYALNPLIYGHHLSIEPIAVLVILLVGEHLFGAWGLLLGVPASAFVVQYMIRGEEVS